jgi:hypothetical protein
MYEKEVDASFHALVKSHHARDHVTRQEAISRSGLP